METTQAFDNQPIHSHQLQDGIRLARRTSRWGQTCMAHSLQVCTRLLHTASRLNLNPRCCGLSNSDGPMQWCLLELEWGCNMVQIGSRYDMLRTREGSCQTTSTWALINDLTCAQENSLRCLSENLCSVACQCPIVQVFLLEHRHT